MGFNDDFEEGAARCSVVHGFCACLNLDLGDWRCGRFVGTALVEGAQEFVHLQLRQGLAAFALGRRKKEVGLLAKALENSDQLGMHVICIVNGARHTKGTQTGAGTRYIVHHQSNNVQRVRLLGASGS